MIYKIFVFVLFYPVNPVKIQIPILLNYGNIAEWAFKEPPAELTKKVNQSLPD